MKRYFSLKKWKRYHTIPDHEMWAADDGKEVKVVDDGIQTVDGNYISCYTEDIDQFTTKYKRKTHPQQDPEPAKEPAE